MHLIYLDESGNSGNNLADPAQPVFVLCAMIVEEAHWLNLERSLEQSLQIHFVGKRPEEFEIHGNQLRNGSGFFKGVSIADRANFRNHWFALAAQHHVKVVYRAIEKNRYATWISKTFGPGVSINPHVAAFALVSKVVNDYLKNLPGKPLGMFISDENQEITVDVEKSIQVLRGSAGAIGLTQIVEKGFFIDSKKSLPLQLCDLFALWLRKHEEVSRGLAPSKFIDSGAFGFIQPMLHRADEGFQDVIAWLTSEEKKKRPGN